MTRRRRTWREVAQNVIQTAIKENEALDRHEMRKLISSRYPFGQRSMHPYKVWCEEVRKWLFVKYGPDPNDPKSKVNLKRASGKPSPQEEISPNQLKMF